MRDNGNNDIGQYFVQADIRVKADDFTGDTLTLGRQDIGGVSVGHHERSTDDDWFRVDLDAGKSYRFVLFSDEREFLANPNGSNGFYYFSWDNASFSIRDGSGAIVQKRAETWPASDNLIEFVPSNSGTYFVSVAPGPSGRTIPDYRVIASEVQPDPVSPALVIQPDAAQVNDVRFPSIRDLASTAVNDEILTVNNNHSSAIRFDLSG